MARRHKVDEIHLELYDIIPFNNERRSGVILQWSSDIGFGEYTLFKNNGSDEWCGESEHMDNNEDREFIRYLLRLWADQLNIVE